VFAEPLAEIEQLVDLGLSQNESEDFAFTCQNSCGSSLWKSAWHPICLRDTRADDDHAYILD
jgi:hypothetical protein